MTTSTPTAVLKKISTVDASLGMFVQALEGPWLTHPFWRTKFVLTDPSDLAALKASSVPALWIDVSKGCDLPAPFDEAPEAREALASALPSPIKPGTAPSPAPRVHLADELGRAGEVLQRARQAVSALSALFNEARLGKSIDPEGCLPFVEEITSSLARNPSAFISLARLKTKDDYTYMHSVAVCGLMVTLARHLGLAEAEVREAGLAGLLHDVGKMQMPLDVLNKPGALTDAEFCVMRSHPERGYEMLKEGTGVPDSALDVCLHHHEKMDGSGYPHRLAGEQISRLARMGAICDVYDAITSARPYKAAWDPAASIQRMSQWKGQFDPSLFSAFVTSVGIYPTGALVRLQSGRLAVVVDQTHGSLVKPRVRVFFSTRSNMPIPLQLLDLSSPHTTDRIVGREPLEDWNFPHIDQLWKQADHS
jgi:putative nucleotidyltransferase with HDIG domain